MTFALDDLAATSPVELCLKLHTLGLHDLMESVRPEAEGDRKYCHQAPGEVEWGGVRPDLGDVQSVCESPQRLAGVRQPEVQRRLLQHLLVAVGVVLAVGGEGAAVVPVLLH